MKQQQTTVKELGTILGIWAHPDDEIFSCSGLMMEAVRNGQEVIVITATKGDAGFKEGTGMTAEKMASIREMERDAALEIVGVQKGYWLGYRDGQLIDIASEKAVTALKDIVGSRQIDTVVTFEQYGITGHDDHKTVHVWAKTLAQEISASLLCAVENEEFYLSHGKELHEKYDIYFNIDKPRTIPRGVADLCVQLDSNAMSTKLQALKAHRSQTAALFSDTDFAEHFAALCSCECFMFE